MKAEEKAAAICDKIGLTDENERFWFIRGYSRGAIDTELECLKGSIETLSKTIQVIPHETR